MKLIKHEVDFYLNKLKEGEFFSFSRWGDGEWLCATGSSGMNCDRHIYFDELKRGLNNALINDKGYYKAIWDFEHGQIKRVLNIILTHVNQLDVKTDWVDAGIWENLVLVGGIEKLKEQLENMNFIMISNNDKRRINLKYVDFIEIPKINCFLEKERIKNDILEMVNKYDKPVFGLSASMATNVIIDELYDEIGNKCWMIDFGSIWDPFVGINSRSYHSEYKINKL